MLVALGIAGLVLSLAGTGLAMWGQDQANKQQIEDDKLKAQQLLDQQTFYNQQIKVQKAEMAAQQQVYGIQSARMARAEGAREGSLAASAAVSNLSGESVLRRTMASRRDYQEQATMARVSYKSSVRQGKLEIASTRLQSKQAGENAAQYSAHAKWLNDYGWMSVAAIGLQGAGSAIRMGANMDWSWAQGSIASAPPLTPEELNSTPFSMTNLPGPPSPGSPGYF